MPQKSAMWQKSDAKNCQTLSVSVSCGIHIIKKYPALSIFPGGVVDRAPTIVEHFALGIGSIPTSGKMFFRTFFVKYWSFYRLLFHLRYSYNTQTQKNAKTINNFLTKSDEMFIMVLLWWSYTNATYKSPLFRRYFIAKNFLWLVQESLRGSRMPQKSAMWQKSDAKNWQTLSVSVSCGIHIIQKYPNQSIFPGGQVDRAPA